ncbi:CYTH domain-containing protein [Bacillus sp. FJAT-49736]|uniref:CYTH domain-containing protein n=1 Tax=Bacillus sp. FJAT-49736 TaxID=2833582 RepID=UPI001BC9B501|nr:CYTH domain-containing protein [Bacillus sp. FJAT-49736]MBS4172056.1 CYTH domain-containing protein [Bacillus sp. FJAT-49736]
MSKELEIEFKNMVTKEEFYRMMKEFNILSRDFIEQQNYYFDTPEFDIKGHHSALRIRRKNDKYELTLKQPAKDGNWETNEKMEEKAALSMIKTGLIPEGEIKTSLKMSNISVENIICFGSLTTKRVEIPYQDGLLVFDNSFYLNKEDFEIEYEVKDKKMGEQHFLRLMDRLQIPIRSTDNKIIRFYREYKKLQ